MIWPSYDANSWHWLWKLHCLLKQFSDLWILAKDTSWLPKASKKFILEILWVSYLRISFTKPDGFVGKNRVSQSQNLTSKFEVREGACISLQNSDDQCSLFEILLRYFQVWERNVLAFPDSTQKFHFYFAWAWSPLTILH